MVQRLQEIVSVYEHRLWEMQLVPRFSYGRGLQPRDGAPNSMFLTYLFGHQEMAIQFLKDVGLIPSRMQCNICERDMTWTADLTSNDGFRWRCRRSVAGVRCRGTASIRHGSWFRLSNLTLLEIITLTYDILRRDSAHQIEDEHNCTADTLTALIREWIETGTMVVSDCWGAYRDLESQGYKHSTVNHSLYFKDPETGAHTNTIEGTWSHVKVFLRNYTKAEDYR